MVFVKPQSQVINGKEYNYYYLYHSYRPKGSDNPTNFKVGKVGDDIDSIVGNLKDKADKKGFDISAQELSNFRDTLERIDENSNTIEEKVELINEHNRQEEEKGEEEDEGDIPEEIGEWNLEYESPERIIYGANDQLFATYGKDTGWMTVDFGKFNQQRTGYPKSDSVAVADEDKDFEYFKNWLKNLSPPEAVGEYSKYVDMEDESEEDSDSSEEEVRNYDWIDQIGDYVEKGSYEGFRDMRTGVRWYIADGGSVYDAELVLTGKDYGDAVGIHDEDWDKARETVINWFNDVEKTVEFIVSEIKKEDKGFRKSTLRDRVMSGIEPSSYYGDDFDWANQLVLYAIEVGTSDNRLEMKKGTVQLGYESSKPGSEDSDSSDSEDEEMTDVSDAEEDFKSRFLDIVDSLGLEEYKDIPDDLEVEKLNSSQKTKEGKYTKTEALAKTRMKGGEVIGLSVNPKMWENATENRKKYIAIHEATHLKHDRGHRWVFFTDLKEYINEYYGDFEPFREMFENDVRISGDKTANRMINIESLDKSEVNNFAQEYLDNIYALNEEEGGFEELSFRASTQYEGGQFKAFVGRGRGKDQIHTLTIDLNTSEVKYRNDKYSQFFENRDLDVGQLSNKFDEAYKQLKNSNRYFQDEETVEEEQERKKKEAELQEEVSDAVIELMKEEYRNGNEKLSKSEISDKLEIEFEDKILQKSLNSLSRLGVLSITGKDQYSLTKKMKKKVDEEGNELRQELVEIILDSLKEGYDDGMDSVPEFMIKQDAIEKSDFEVSDMESQEKFEDALDDAFERLSSRGDIYQPKKDNWALVEPGQFEELQDAVQERKEEEERLEGYVRFAQNGNEILLEEGEYYWVQWKNSGESFSKRDPFPQKASEIKELFEDQSFTKVTDSVIKWSFYGDMGSKDYRVDPDDKASKQDYEEYQEEKKKQAEEDFEEELEELSSPYELGGMESRAKRLGDRAGLSESEVEEKIEEAKEKASEQKEEDLNEVKESVKEMRDSKYVTRFDSNFDTKGWSDELSDLRGWSDRDYDDIRSKFRGMNGVMIGNDSMTVALLYEDSGISASEVKNFFTDGLQEFDEWKTVEVEDSDDTVYVPEFFDEDADSSYNPEYVNKLDKVFKNGYRMFTADGYPLVIIPTDETQWGITVAPRISDDAY